MSLHCVKYCLNSLEVKVLRNINIFMRGILPIFNTMLSNQNHEIQFVFIFLLYVDKGDFIHQPCHTSN